MFQVHYRYFFVPREDPVCAGRTELAHDSGFRPHNVTRFATRAAAELAMAKAQEYATPQFYEFRVVPVEAL